MIRERANPKPLHNFALPCLRWGNRKQARCMKMVEHSAWPSISAVQRHTSVLPSFGQSRLAPSILEEEEEEEEGGDGIDAVREKLLLDLRAETDRIQEELLKGHDDVEEEAAAAAVTMAVVAEVGKELTGGAAATDRHEEDQVTETRPWRLRTRKTSWKAPVAAGSAARDDSPARKESVPASRGMKGLPEKRKQRTRFAVALRKKEIEEDFVKLTGHRPPRRPKKRRCTVQKRLDVLFPGQWLTEVKADAYKVIEAPSKSARRTDRSA
ncbi:hypothetical protein MLD38_011416 [Melastoma candidum]|uniref:Uncharacterized protein n=1 Tax=Melastoma candidum TaxID=119954 RepID=A0ACB9R2Z9_9MYRT|nr:hypothetical protein MLD38_011416 [Melastoma candidum]